MKRPNQCECRDTACSVHPGHVCNASAVTRLYRVDFDDMIGTRFCDACAEDAMESGVFTDTVPLESWME